MVAGPCLVAASTGGLVPFLFQSFPFITHLSQAGGEGAVHCGGVLLGGGLPCKEEKARALSQQVVVLTPQAAHGDAAVAAQGHLILAPPCGHCLQSITAFQSLGMREPCV